MANTTAMQELRDDLIEIIGNHKKDDSFDDNYILALANIVKDIDAQMMEKEKTQIVGAFNSCYNDLKRTPPFYSGSGQEYYNQTYKQKE